MEQNSPAVGAPVERPVRPHPRDGAGGRDCERRPPQRGWRHLRNDCTHAPGLVAAGKGREDCHEWRPVEFVRPNRH